MIKPHLRSTHKIAVIALLAALAVSTDYAMLPLANIKLMDTIVFVAALLFGLDVGVSVGGLTWLVYGSINPQGAAGGPLLVLLIISETVYAFLGYIARTVFNFEDSGVPTRRLLWACLGTIGALIYDLNTIITPSLLSGAPLDVAVASLVPAALFMVAHEASDFIFFGTVGPSLAAAMLRVAKARGLVVWR